MTNLVERIGTHGYPRRLPSVRLDSFSKVQLIILFVNFHPKSPVRCCGYQVTCPNRGGIH